MTPCLSKAYVSPVSFKRPRFKIRVNSFSGRIRSPITRDRLGLGIRGRDPSDRIHRRHIRRSLTKLVNQRNDRHERTRNGRPVGQRFSGKFDIGRQCFLPNQCRRGGCHDAVFSIDHDVSYVSLGLQQRGHRLMHSRRFRGLQQIDCGRIFASHVQNRQDALPHRRVLSDQPRTGCLRLQPQFQRFDVRVQNRLQFAGQLPFDSFIDLRSHPECGNCQHEDRAQRPDPNVPPNKSGSRRNQAAPSRPRQGILDRRNSGIGGHSRGRHGSSSPFIAIAGKLRPRSSKDGRDHQFARNIRTEWPISRPFARSPEDQIYCHFNNRAVQAIAQPGFAVCRR